MTEAKDRYIMRPLTEQAKAWMYEHVPEYPGFGRSFIIDRPYLDFVLDELGDTEMVRGIDYELAN